MEGKALCAATIPPSAFTSAREATASLLTRGGKEEEIISVLTKAGGKMKGTGYLMTVEWEPVRKETTPPQPPWW